MSKCERPLSVEERERGMALVEIAAREYGVSPEDVLGDRRLLMTAQARQAAMVVLRRAGWTTSAIGALLNRDHSTVSTGSTMYARRVRTDPDARRMVERIEQAWRKDELHRDLWPVEQRVRQIHDLVTDGRRALQELEKEADALLAKMRQAVA